MSVYLKYPSKAIKDTYTPAAVKLQTLMMMLSLLLFCFMPVYPPIIVVSIVLWLAVMTSSLPFAIKSFKLDMPLAILVPFIVLLRSIVFAVGSLIRIVTGLYKGLENK